MNEEGQKQTKQIKATLRRKIKIKEKINEKEQRKVKQRQKKLRNMKKTKNTLYGLDGSHLTCNLLSLHPRSRCPPLRRQALGHQDLN